MHRFIALFLIAAVSSVAAGPNVLTHHNDNLRTGANLIETVLTPANVNANQFGKLFDQSVDGQVYAQPLYTGGVQMSGTAHNIVFVATENDSVYAFDADSNTGSNANPLWHDSYIDPAAGITTVSSSDVGTTDIFPEIGITSTPVIDPATSTIYVVATTKENGVFFQRLHALDIATGQEKFGGPLVIAANVLGTGDGSSNGVIAFDPLTQNQRSALLLLNGVVYIAWSSHGDNGPAHGWVIGYDPHTLAQVSTYLTTPDGGLGTIWMSGCGPSADAQGNIYFSTGNGNFESDAAGHHIGNDFGDSLLKLSSTHGGLALADYFTPADQNYLNNNDLDFGSGGVMLLPDQPGPHRHLGIVTGKESITFVFDRDKLGGYFPNAPRNAGMYEGIANAIVGSFGTPAYFNGHIYYHGSDYGGHDVLKSFTVRSGYVIPTPQSMGTDVFDYPGATPSISANGAANGIVWEIENNQPASLYASRADDVSQRLYTSDDAGSRDQPAGNGVKFTVPTVTNGKVYIGTDGSLTVYGLLHDTTALTVNISGSGAITNGFAGSTNRQTNSTFTITATPSAGSVFDSWTDQGGNVISRSPTLTFTMSENLVLNANFVPDPFPNFAGQYLGLIQGASPNIASAGYISVTAGKSGVFSAVIRFAGRTLILHGVFNADGTFSTVLQPASSHPTVVSLTADGSGDLTGTVSSGVAGGNVMGHALVDAARPLPTNLIGKYTLLFPVPADPTSPQGIGYGSAIVDKFGHVRLAGVMGDGTPFTEASILSQSQTWPIFVGLYSGRGLLSGIMTFETNSGVSDIDGPLFWYKPRSGSPPLSTVTDAIGSVYEGTANPILPLTSGTGTLILQLSTPVSRPVTSDAGIISVSGTGVTLTFNPASGFFGGRFTSGHAAGKYGGAVFQDQNLGQGTYILSGTTGAVNLQ